jgi:hypothetical protein
MIAALQRRWIPPWALAAGQVAHLASWLLLFALASAAARPLVLGMSALAWLHAVVLGWLTLTALAVLVHVIPAFTDAAWRGEGIARAAIAVYAAGVAALVWGFWNGAPAVLPWAGGLIAVALLAYFVPAAMTLAAAFGGPRREAAIARALLITLLALALTAGIGLVLTRTFSPTLAPVHGAFGIVGWLTLLVMGVSTRTIRPITGAAFRSTTTHIAVGTLELAGTIAFAFSMWLGAMLMTAGAIVYAGDLVEVLRRATVAHRAPQAFVAAALVWLLDGAFLGIWWLAGAPWGAAAVYVLVVGWIGQMVNAHIHHIGIRLIATIGRGDDDETRPEELLSAPLSWTTFAFFQLAVAAGTLALVRTSPSLLAWAALAGIAGWCALAANITVAACRSVRSPRTA